MEYPVSEVFTSPQGEGLWVGTMMHFIRLAGCSVGKPYSDATRAEGKLPVYTERCTLYDDRTFACDTDYRVKQRLSVETLVSGIPRGIKHVCITGGEPLIHNLEPLFLSLVRSGYRVHLETSGTKPLPASLSEMWVTVSPKKNALYQMMKEADEIKLLVDGDFDWNSVPEVARKHERVYIQPVNGEHHVDADNLQRCMELQQAHPEVRVCVQLHKVLSEITRREVR